MIYLKFIESCIICNFGYFIILLELLQGKKLIYLSRQFFLGNFMKKIKENKYKSVN